MKTIVNKYLEGRATEAEQVKLLKWLRNKENRIVFNSFRLDWKNGLDKATIPEGSRETWSNIQSQMLQESFKGWQNSLRMYQLLRYAAIFFFVIGVGSLVYIFNNLSKQPPEYYTSVIAEKGHISKVELPDGSLVWLNSGSEISYNNYFFSKNRDIKLTGEAYFH
ncbi:Putative anti-sigma factor, partial [hydrothermal vent metagenome]